jgi:putative hydrolase of HD superfamily
MKHLNAIADFLFEVGMLSKTPRSFTYFLGSGQQSVADHLNRVTIIGYVLSYLKKQKGDAVDEKKVLEMCLFHDVPEARTSDLNYVHQKYAYADEQKVTNDLANTVPFGADIKTIIEERNDSDSVEAMLARDADQLEFILSLREQMDAGNTRAETWLPSAVKRLKTKEAQELAATILETPSDNWWFHDKEDPWWVNRDKID